MAAKKRKERSNDAQIPSKTGSVLEQQNSKRVKWDSQNSIDDIELDATYEAVEDDPPDKPSDVGEEGDGKVCAYMHQYLIVSLYWH